MNENLIIDVGMHVGKDTEFYLRKGFDVVAIEANPYLVEKAKKRLSAYINNKRLIIHDIAISDHVGEVEFYVNREKDDWGTISKEWATRKENLGTTNSVIPVKCTTFDTILQNSGIPYYLKVDIEGVDNLCLEALLGFETRPKYISIEAHRETFEELFTQVTLLWHLGYRRFKIVNQAMNHRLRCPDPPREGTFVDAKFDAFTSGLFGEETRGEWLGIEKTLKKCRCLVKEYRLFGDGKRYNNTVLRRLFEICKRERVGWYDIHAKFGVPQEDETCTTLRLID